MIEKIFTIKKKKTKFILSLVSAILYLLGQGVLVGATGMSVYILSYIHHKDKWVDMQYGNLMTPLISLFLSIFAPLSGPLEKNFGPITSLFISSLIIEICLFLFYLQRNIWFFYFILASQRFTWGIYFPSITFFMEILWIGTITSFWKTKSTRISE